MSTTTIQEAGPTTAHTAGSGVPRSALTVFLAERPRLVNLALKVVGDVATAEDVVQDAWLRWQQVEREPIRNSAAFLTTTTNNLAINVVRSARRRHEVVGDAVLDRRADGGLDIAQLVETTAAVEDALLLMMRRLAPDELTAYLLRKGFDYPYRDIAALLRTGLANARQLVHRAGTRLGGDGTARPVETEAHRRLVAAFLHASQHGRFTELEAVLTGRQPSRSGGLRG